MKKKKFIGVILAAVLALALTACVYYEEDEQVPQPPVIRDEQVTPPQPPVTGENNLPQAAIDLPDGTFRGVAALADFPNIGGGTWRRGDMVVDVVIANNQITSINVVSHGESMYGPMYFFRGYPMTPDVILIEQSTLGVRIALEGERNSGNLADAAEQAIHVFTGATNTQEVIVKAVEDALRNAGVDPMALTRVNQIENMTAPLAGDRFIPGSHLIHIPADTYIYYRGQFFHYTDIPAHLPAWGPPGGFNDAGVGQPAPLDDRWPAAEAYETGVLSRGGIRYNGHSVWRYGIDAEGNAVATDLGAGPIVAQRVLFHTRIYNRNQNAAGTQSVHGPTFAETMTASADVPLAPAIVNILERFYGTDVNPYYVPGEITPVGMWILVNFGRDYFQIVEHGSGAGLMGAGISSGDSTAGPREGATGYYGRLAPHAQDVIGSSSSQGLGGYWWMQVAHRTINDNQSTHLVTLDAYSGATQSAIAVRMGVERAMMAAGANPANITPRPAPFFREPAPANPDALMLIPGRYYITIPGFGRLNDGNDTVGVTLCREVIRYISSANMNRLNNPEHGQHANLELAGRPGSEALEDWVRFRNDILFTFSLGFGDGGRQLSALDGIAPMEGYEELSAAIITALQDLLRRQSYNYGPSQAGRLGIEIERTTDTRYIFQN